jgi:hypothetical protein
LNELDPEICERLKLLLARQSEVLELPKELADIEIDRIESEFEPELIQLAADIRIHIAFYAKSKLNANKNQN